MLMINERSDNRSSSRDQELSTLDSNETPWDKLLVDPNEPKTEIVAISSQSTTETAKKNEPENKRKPSILSNFHRRTFSKLSFKGESGPLLTSSGLNMEETSLKVGEKNPKDLNTAGHTPMDQLGVTKAPQHHHLGDATLSGLRRAISQVSMMVVKATSSSESAWREELFKYRQTRFNSRRVRKRVVFKHGDCNVVQGNVAKRRRRYLQDIFTTLVDAQWRWTLMVFAMNFLLSWLGFAIIWWLIAHNHGDFDPKNTDNPNTEFTPCVMDLRGFTSCFLFSVETQHTIGYGSKHTTEECPEAIFVMCIQSMTGVILQAFMVGIVFAKLSRPKKRTQTLLFSRNAVICQRDGQPCLMFRVGDMRKSHIIEAHVRAQMIRRKVTREGELLPFFQTELKVGGDGEEDKIFFIWPTTIVHKINHQSPLYHINASDMLRERFEIIVMLEGVIESTGMTTQARSSYLPSEILWGHRFEHIITFRKQGGEYEVNYTLFNNTYEVDTPLCSSAELDAIKAMHQAKERGSSGVFQTYRDVSSSSLTTSSGSSYASSTGGLQMHPSLPLNPIPVMITSPDGSLRRESFNTTTEPKPVIFYQDEIEKHDIILTQPGDEMVIEEQNPQDIRAVIIEDDHEVSKIVADSSKDSLEQLRRSCSRVISEQGHPRKSASRTTLDSRQSKYPESTDKSHHHHHHHDHHHHNHHQRQHHHGLSRQASVSDSHHKVRDPQRKTSFRVTEDERKDIQDRIHRITPPREIIVTPDIEDSKNLNHSQQLTTQGGI